MPERLCPQRFSLHRGIWLDCLRQWSRLPTTTAGGGPKDRKRATVMKRLSIFSGLLFFVFVAPERDFQNSDNTFQAMLNSVRIRR